MAESILPNSLFKLITSSRWEVDSVEYNHHYQTGKTIALSVYCHNKKLMKSTGWFYFHERQIIDGKERGIQFSFSRPLSNASQMFNVPASKISMYSHGDSSLEIIIYDVLMEDGGRKDISFCLVNEKGSINLFEIKEYFENNC
jgi:hypothetical protein